MPGEPEFPQSLPSLAASTPRPELHATDILEAISDGFQAFDRQWRYTYLNRQAERILGRSRTELLGKVCWEEYPEAVGTPFYDHYMQAMEKGVTVVFEDHCPHQDTWVEFTLQPLPDGLTAYTRDITERKRAEQQIREAEARQHAFLREILASVTEGRLRLCETDADLPVASAPLGEALLVGLGGAVGQQATALRDLRRYTLTAGRLLAFSDDRIRDMMTAANEAATNAIKHGGGGTATVHVIGAEKETGEHGASILVYISDKGGGISLEQLPRATLERGYSSADTLGHGFFLMLKTVDRVYLLTGPNGTTVVLEQARIPPFPFWL